LILKFHVGLTIFLAGLVLFLSQARASDFDLAETAGAMRTWHNAEGLPSDSVTAICQTRDGFLWVGTTAGLVRFDGVKFTEVKLDASGTNNQVHISALCEDSDGYLWIGTQQNGLFQLARGSLEHYAKEQGLLDNTVTSLAVDAHGQVWIGSKSGLNLWSRQRFKSFTKKDGLPDEFVSGVNVARSGTVWITLRNGMCRIIDGQIMPYEFQAESQGRSPEYLGTYEDRQGNLWAFGDTYLINLTEGKRFNYFRSSESASVRIWSLCEGRNGRIWIGTSGRGLCCFEDNHFQPVILGENRWPYDVRAICEDREGNLWLGTSGGGLVQLRPQSVHILRAGQIGSSTTALVFDAAGRVYVGLQRGGLFVGEAGRFDRVAGSEGLDIQNYISSLCVTRDGVLWAGTLGGGLYGLHNGRGVHLTTANGLADDNVLAVCADVEGGIWTSTSAGTVHRFTGRDWARFDMAAGLSGSPVTVMIPSAAGGLWLGTQDGRIFREENDKFSRVATLPNSGSCPILTLHEDEPGRLWIGTSGGGLTHMINGTTFNWNTGNGLPSDIVAGVVEDQAKNLWLATGAGIYRVNRGDIVKTLNNLRVPLACKLIAEAKTLPEFTLVSGGVRALMSPDGELWFATSEGVLNVNTRRSEIEPSVIPLQLESATFNGQPPISLLRGGLWSPVKTNSRLFKAPGDVSSLEIHFTALNFSPREIRFRHKLDGLDLDWVEDAGNRSARYAHLSYGNYRFRVAIRTGDGPWQEAADTFTFVVPTPFYRQGWAIFLFSLLAIALVTGIVRLVSHRRLRLALARLEQQQSLERERMRIARDMHDEMGSKLTKISFLSEHAQVDAESSGPLAEKIQSIAQTSRDLLQTMDEIVWVVNPQNDTLENLVAYLSHYALEYFQNTSIECELQLPREILHYPLVSEVRHNLFLTFEEALNNVLKHANASKVKVEMTVTPREFEVKVTDNGKGFVAPVLLAPPAPARGGRGGNGLKNMRQRLMEIGGECLVSSQTGNGTAVTLRIRLNLKAARKS